jgi:2-polyprenyl-3-methyl-5-hydroxy-6-metoxy-1,4-benzoquinol methylase
MDMTTAEYAVRLKRQTVWWKVLLDVQAPYRRNLRRLNPGYTLDVGCGIGRNLVNIDGVGIDSNKACVTAAKARGLTVYEPEEFSAEPESFDSLLFSHVLEHLNRSAARELVGHYLPYLKPKGQVILVTPQERGFQSDDTHVQFLDLEALRQIVESLELEVESACSFPFPRWAGRLFKYNEFWLTARV